MNPQMFFLLNSEMPPDYIFGMNSETFTSMLFIFLNVVILAVVMTKVLYQPVKKMLADRTARIQSDIESAEQERAKANELKSQYEIKVNEIQKEKEAILEEARKLAVENKEMQMAAAKSEADAVKARAQKEIKMEQDRAQDEMKNAVINISSAIASKFLAKNIDAATHEQLFNETMVELEGMAWRS